MHHRVPRLLIAAGLLLLLPACQSRDAGKLVGKWQVVSAPGVSATITETWEFKPDGSFSLSATARGGPTVTPFTGQYHLDFFNRLHMDHLNKPVNGANAMATHVTINGDDMTMRDDNGSVSQLKRGS